MRGLHILDYDDIFDFDPVPLFTYHQYSYVLECLHDSCYDKSDPDEDHLGELNRFPFLPIDPSRPVRQSMLCDGADISSPILLATL
mmetsp:Transcript_21545/g.32071  ORF Transcript_21545/g.32071 Transcript_21545/m.32071 type:complete len:86 (-) Transcript_21545:63-320(-)